MKPLQIYRRRLIPDELILLKDDVVLEQGEEIILTKWKTIRPKTAFSHGCSCYFLRDGIKVSKFYRADGSLLYWYCDVVSYDYDRENNVLTVTDLLADVIVYPDGAVRVVDLDEVAEAFEKGILSKEQMSACLRQLNDLLSYIYRDKFERLQEHLERLGV